MHFLADRNEIAQLGEGLHGCVSDQPLTDATSCEMLALLHGFENQPDCEARVSHDSGQTGKASLESGGQLQKVAPGPYRSRGGYFDYTDWTDRERFLELDRAIARASELYRANDELDEILFIAA